MTRTEPRRETLAGKVAIVTGGTRGIGAAIVRRLAAEGAKVAFDYVASAAAAEALAKEVGGLAFRADQADPAQVRAFVSAAAEGLGKIDIVVCSAGLFSTGVVGDPDADFVALERMLAVDVRGVAETVRAAVPRRTTADAS